jgi:hypothetical protein
LGKYLINIAQNLIELLLERKLTNEVAQLILGEFKGNMEVPRNSRKISTEFLLWFEAMLSDYQDQLPITFSLRVFWR